MVQAQLVHGQQIQPLAGDGARDVAVGLDQRVVAHALEHAVGDAGRAARATGDLQRAVGVDADLEDVRRALHDVRQLLGRVQLQPERDAEAVAQRVGEHARARGGADERKVRQVHADGARRRALADHDVQRVVLHGGVEHLLHRAREAMDLVDKQDVAGVQARQDGGQVTRALDGRPRGDAQLRAHLRGHDARQRGLAQARRAVEQHVIQRLMAQRRGLHVDAQRLLDCVLPGVFRQCFGSQRGLQLVLEGVVAHARHAIFRHILSPVSFQKMRYICDMARSASRISSSVLSDWSLTLLSAPAASPWV